MTRPGGRACTAPTTTAVRGARSLAWRLLSRFQPRIHEWRLVTVAPAEKRKKRKPAFFERTKAITLFGAGRIEAYETEQSAKGCGMRLLSVSVFPFPTGSVVARLREHLCKAERNLPGGSKRLQASSCPISLSRAPESRPRPSRERQESRQHISGTSDEFDVFAHLAQARIISRKIALDALQDSTYGCAERHVLEAADVHSNRAASFVEHQRARVPVGSKL